MNNIDCLSSATVSEGVLIISASSQSRVTRGVAVGRRAGLTDPDGGLYSYAYSAIDQLTFIERPGGYVSTLAYDPASRLSTIKHSSGLGYTYNYDAANRILNVLSAEAGTLITNTSYGYDNVGNRTTMMTLSGSTSAYTYDAKDRLIQDNTTGTNAHNFTYAFDPVDNRLSTTETIGYVAYSYDAASRLTTSVNASGNTTYLYTLEGTQSQVTQPAGGALYTFVQDVEYKLASQTATPGGTRNWYYDANGKLQSYSGPTPAGTVTIIWDGDDYLGVRM